MNTILIKLNHLLNSRYGKGLELRRLMDLSRINMESEHAVHGNDLYIPIIVENQFLGTAIIPFGWELCEDNKKKIAQLVRMALEPKLYSEFLERRENNLQYQDVEETVSDPAKEKKLITSFLHLHGHDDSLLKKVALQIHDFSARWAFVPFEDICTDLKTVFDICNLGATTLYVPNVESLSEEQQRLLADYVRCPRSLAEPLLLTASTYSRDSLSKKMVNTELFSELQGSYLEVERTPLDSKTLRELLDLFFYEDEGPDLH